MVDVGAEEQRGKASEGAGNKEVGEGLKHSAG